MAGGHAPLRRSWIEAWLQLPAGMHCLSILLQRHAGIAHDPVKAPVNKCVTVVMWVQNGSAMLRLPRMCPPNAARVFYECTKVKPDDRPDAMSLVEWLREEE